MRTMAFMTHHHRARRSPFIRFREVCELLGMHPDSGYAHVRAKTFPVPTVKVGSLLKCRRADVEAFIAGDAA